MQRYVDVMVGTLLYIRASITLCGCTACKILTHALAYSVHHVYRNRIGVVPAVMLRITLLNIISLQLSRKTHVYQQSVVHTFPDKAHTPDRYM